MKDACERLKGLRPDDTLEVPVTTNGWLVVDGGSVVGKMVIDTVADEVAFKWESASVAWPASFTLEKPDGHSVPTMTTSDVYEHQAFPGGSASFDVSGCDYEIKDGSTVIGWLKVNGSNTEWYGKPAYVSGGYLDVTGTSLTFDANTATGNETAHKLVDDEL